METPIIKERFSPEIKTFTKAEFLEHLANNKDELAKYTTYKLNKMFAINGYRITKLNKEIALISDRWKSKTIENDQTCSNSIENDQKHSNTIENDQKRSNVLENDQKRSNTINMVEALKILDEKITYVIEVLREHGWIESD
jgi:ribosomal protein L29